MCRKSCLQAGQPSLEPTAIPDGKPTAMVRPGFHQLERSISVPITVIDAQRTWLMDLINGVAPPIPHGDVQFAVAVEIPGGDARPQPSVRRETPGSRHVLEMAVLIPKHTYRSPFQCQRQVGETIAV